MQYEDNVTMNEPIGDAYAGIGDGGGVYDATEDSASFDNEDITTNDAWPVIDAYFSEKGLVRQQLDSYNAFAKQSLTSIVHETPVIVLSSESQHAPGGDDLRDTEEREQHIISFGDTVYVSKPTYVAEDGTLEIMWPSQARLRNLTYSAPIYLDIKHTIHRPGGSLEEDEEHVVQKVPMGRLPLMLQSEFCLLSNMDEKELARVGECPYDQGGYFIINGSEKVLIAQERSNANHVYVFTRRQPSKYTHVSEVRSVAEGGNRVGSQLYVKTMNSSKGAAGQFIRVTVPFIKQDIRSGIILELEEVEARYGEYPETLAFVELLNTLLDHRGLRPPIYGSAVAFVRDIVLGKHGSRAYRKQSDPWLIASAALGTLLRVAKDYEQDAELLEQQVESSPAFQTVRQFMDSSSVVLRTVLALITTGSSTLGVETPSTATDPDYTAAVECAVVRALQLLAALLHLQTTFASHIRTIAAAPVPAALDLAIVRHANMIQAVGTLVGHPSERIGVSAVQLIHLVALRQPGVAALFTQDTLGVLTAACSERLETGGVKDVMDDEFLNVSSAREAVLSMLLDTLRNDAHGPSLGQLLLGFKATWHATSDGMNESIGLELDQSVGPTCFHAALELLETVDDYSTLAACAELLYTVCADSASTTAALGFLRQRDKEPGFALSRVLDIASTSPTVTGLKDAIAQLDIIGYLLRTVVVDLRAANHDTAIRSYAHSTVSTLLGFGGNEHRLWLLSLLDAIHLPVSLLPPQPDLSSLSGSALLNGLDVNRWRYTHGRTGVVMHDISGLHRTLTAKRRELEAQYSQYRALAQESDEILHAAAAFNARAEMEGAACRAFDGWRALVDITTGSDLGDVVKGDAVGHAQLTVLHAILPHTENPDHPANLKTSYCRAILSLASGLRASRRRVDAGPPAAPAELHVAIRGIVSLICSPGLSGIARGSLHAALLDLFRYETVGNDESSRIVTREFKRGVVSIIETALDPLIIRMSRDASEGPVWSRSAALAALSGIVDVLGSRGDVAIAALVRTGLLQQTLRDASRLDDDGFAAVVGASVEALRRVFLHEQRWSLLLRCSVAPGGGQVLAEQGALPLLCEAAYLDQRPDDSGARTASNWLATQPSIDRYRLVALPALRLVSALVNGVPKSKSVARQCVVFIQAHSELISTILHQRGPWDSSSMEELWLVVSLFAALARHHPDIHNTLRSEYTSILAALWPVMVLLCEDTEAAAEAALSDEQGDVEFSLRSRIHETCRTLLLYCKALSNRSGTPRLVFSPVFSRHGGVQRRKDGVRHVGGLDPPLSALVSYMKSALLVIHSSSRRLKAVRLRLETRADVIVGGEWNGGVSKIVEPIQNDDMITRDVARLIRCLRAGVEAAVVIIWRHMDVLLYGGTNGEADTMKLSDSDGRELRRAASTLALPLIQELLDSDEGILGAGKDVVHTAAMRIKEIHSHTHMELQRCSNCFSHCPKSSVELHEAFCFRNIRRCDECGDVLPISDVEKHKHEAHGHTECHKRSELASHGPVCPMRTVECIYCTLELPFTDMAEHEYACGSRTEECEKCGSRVLIRDFEAHCSFGCDYSTEPAQRPEIEGLTCPFCYLRCEDFEILQIHVLTECPNKDSHGDDFQLPSTSPDIIELPCELCGISVSLEDFEEHQNNCDGPNNEDMTCSSCGVSLSVVAMATHDCDRVEPVIEKREERIESTLCNRTVSEAVVGRRLQASLDRSITESAVGRGTVNQVQHITRFFTQTNSQMMCTRVLRTVQHLGFSVKASMIGGEIHVKCESGDIAFNIELHNIPNNRACVDFRRISGPEGKFRGYYAKILAELYEEMV